MTHLHVTRLIHMTYLHIWKSHITHEGVMSHTSKSCHTYKWDTSKTKTISIDGMKSMSPNSMNASFYAWLQHTATHCNTLQHTATHWTSLASTLWMRLVTRDCSTLQNTATLCTSQASTLWMTDVTRWIRHVTHMNESEYVTSHIYEWVMSKKKDGRGRRHDHHGPRI